MKYLITKGEWKGMAICMWDVQITTELIRGLSSHFLASNSAQYLVPTEGVRLLPNLQDSQDCFLWITLS